jgi:NhaP-type Na+/H+ or K+/H+ antiporter
MHEGFAHNPALTVALALAAGVVAQAAASHLRIPGIVLLLGAGVTLGPDGAGVVDPASLGHALEALTGFAVAVILFDGGLNLNPRRMRAQAPAIRRLLTLGVVVTAGGGALAARLALGWDWTPSLLFGTLVIVTGPTVVTPLLRRIKVRRRLETILESEGVLIDAVGAVVAVVALEIALSPEASPLAQAQGAAGAPARLLAGTLVGGLGGGLMALLLRPRHLVPDGFENILTLGLTLALYQASNALMAETGIVAAIVAGVVVGNARPRGEHELREFKEQLTVLLIGLLFVLLAADVRVAEVAALGAPGLAAVAALMLVVRPLNVWLCTLRTGLDWREKLFLAWVAPRGIVAAAVASLFARRLAEAGWTGGDELRAMVFLVIAATVVVQGATAAPVARLLGVRRPSDRGYVILGAQPLARLLARLLDERGQEVVMIDTNASYCRDAEAEGLPVIYGNAFDERIQMRAQLDTRRGVIAALHNEAANLRFASVALRRIKVPRAYAVLERHTSAVEPDDLVESGVSLFGGRETDPELWSTRLRRGTARVEAWRRSGGGETTPVDLPEEILTLALPLFREIGDGRLQPVDEETKCGEEITVLWLIYTDREKEAWGMLGSRGWMPAGDAGGGE